MRFKSRSRALVGAAAAGLLGLAGLTTVAPSVGAAEPTVERLAGAERWGTAADIATAAYPDGTDTVVLANGLKFPDALAAGGLAGANNAPILLTTADSLPADTEAALTTLDPANIIVVGGNGVVSDDLVTALEADGFAVTRHAGADRFATAAAIAGELGAVDTVFLANGLNFPDALAASPGAAKAQLPVLLTTADSLNADAAAAIDASGAANVVILGGNAAVSDEIQQGLEDDGLNVTRVQGATRYETATAVADYLIAEHAFNASPVHLATGEKFPDALAGGPLAAINNGPIILTFTDSLAGAADTWLTDNAAAVNELVVFGGEAAVSAATVDAAQAAGDEGTNQSFAVTPAEKATNTVSSNATNAGARQYTVSGLDDAATYDIELHEAEDVNVDANGNVTFDNNAPLAAGDTSIEIVNGAAVGTASGAAASETYEVHNVGPVNGTITFTIDSVVADRVIPVLNRDTDADNTLDLATGTAPTAPTEPFGIGGETEWIPAEAASGTVGTDTTISRVDTDNDFIVAGGATYNYDSNDVFQIATVGTSAAGNEASTCVQVTQATFEANLSTGDELDQSSSYNADPTFSSTLCIEDLTPGSPTAVSATASGSSVTVTWTAPASGADSYNIYRGTDTNNDGCTETLPDTENASYALVGSSTTATFTETNVPDGNHCYAVTSVLDGDESTLGAGGDDEDDVDTPVADTTAPTAVADASVVDLDTGFNDVFDTGDVIRIYFDEAIVLNSPALILTEATGGDVATVDSSNATFAADGSTLTITLTAAPTDNNTTTGDNTLTMPANITNDRGITDSAGNRAVYTDASLEDNGPEFFKDTATTGDTTFTVTFNEALNQTSAEDETNYSYDPDGGGGTAAEQPLTATLSADGRTVTFTVTTAVAANATLNPTGVLDTEGQASAQGATAIN